MTTTNIQDLGHQVQKCGDFVHNNSEAVRKHHTPTMAHPEDLASTIISDYDAPETPAPLFAINAFKHALFGTPAPGNTERKPRRRDLRTVTSAHTKHASSPSQIPRRKTFHGTASAAASPAKGILLTPGTARRQKSVSFGAAARDRATPKDVPGRFPSPSVIESGEKGKKQPAASKLVPSGNTLENDHDSLSSRFKRLTIGASAPSAFAAIEVVPPKAEERQSTGLSTNTGDLDDNDTGSAAYWRAHHERYVSKSMLEMRKLVKREQIARKFGKYKDEEAMKLREALVVEKRKVEHLTRLVRQAEDSKARGSVDAKMSREQRGFVNRDDVFSPPKDELPSANNVAGRKPAKDSEPIPLPPSRHQRQRSLPLPPSPLLAPLSSHPATPSAEPAISQQSHHTTATDTAANGTHSRRPSGDALSSDIWADANTDANASRRPRRRASGPGSLRKPLEEGRGTGNAVLESKAIVGEAEDVKVGMGGVGGEPDHRGPINMILTQKPAAAVASVKDCRSGMSEERREAARIRLEEKKRTRVRV